MVNAKSLFKRHESQFCEVWKNREGEFPIEVQAIIYAACIIAEAIRTEMDETEIKVKDDLR